MNKQERRILDMAKGIYPELHATLKLVLNAQAYTKEPSSHYFTEIVKDLSALNDEFLVGCGYYAGAVPLGGNLIMLMPIEIVEREIYQCPAQNSVAEAIFTKDTHNLTQYASMGQTSLGGFSSLYDKYVVMFVDPIEERVRKIYKILNGSIDLSWTTDDLGRDILIKEFSRDDGSLLPESEIREIIKLNTKIHELRHKEDQFRGLYLLTTNPLSGADSSSPESSNNLLSLSMYLNFEVERAAYLASGALGEKSYYQLFELRRSYLNGQFPYNSVAKNVLYNLAVHFQLLDRDKVNQKNVDLEQINRIVASLIQKNTGDIRQANKILYARTDDIKNAKENNHLLELLKRLRQEEPINSGILGAKPEQVKNITHREDVCELFKAYSSYVQDMLAQNKGGGCSGGCKK